MPCSDDTIDYMSMNANDDLIMEPLFINDDNTCRIINSDAISGMRTINDCSVNTIVTSPPYWGFRAYTGGDDIREIGVEPILNDYVSNMVAVFHECRRILSDDGVLWLNIGDGYTSGGRKTRIGDHIASKDSARGQVYNRPDTPSGLKKKDMLGVPWRVAFALQNDGWYLRADIIWLKPNSMSVGNLYDRPQQDYEHVFMLTKSEKYFYNIEAGYEPSSDGKGTRQGRSVWSIPTEARKTGHPAVMPLALAEKCVMLSSNDNDTVFDPFTGSGTTAIASLNNSRNFIGTELSNDYVNIAKNRILNEACVHSQIIII